MAKHILEPAGDFVLVVDHPRKTVIEDIEMPDNERQQDMAYGTVIFVGPEALKTKPEDQVCYGPYAGKIVVFEGNTFRLLRQGNIELYIRTVE